MKILAAKHKTYMGGGQWDYIDPSTMVNKVGKYIYQHLEGGQRISYQANVCDITTLMYYMIKPEVREQMRQYDEKLHGIGEEIYEMKININITTYTNCLRVNVIEITPDERTLGFFKLTQTDLMSLPNCKDKTMQFIKSRIEKYYDKWEVLL